MNPDLTLAVAGFGGALVGGIVQSIFSYFQTRRQFVRDTRHRDYNIFIEAIANFSEASDESPKYGEFKAKVIETKARILLKSSPAVILALEKFSKHPGLHTPESYNDFASLLAAMRTDIGGELPRSFGSSAGKIFSKSEKK